MKLIEKVLVRGTMELLSGLHIGDSKETVEIGGVDSPVVRRKDNNQPYVPGSSIKGKLRSLLEIAEGSNGKSKFRKGDYSDGSLIPFLFGAASDPGKDNGNPSRLIVRDSYLNEEWAEKLQSSAFTDMPYTEVKFENVINRIKGTAEHPRQIERIPAGAVFNVEFVINVVEDGNADSNPGKEDLLNLLNKGIKFLEDDYLGGSGTRGYGQVSFKLSEPVVKGADEYSQ